MVVFAKIAIIRGFPTFLDNGETAKWRHKRLRVSPFRRENCPCMMEIRFRPGCKRFIKLSFFLNFVSKSSTTLDEPTPKFSIFTTLPLSEGSSLMKTSSFSLIVVSWSNFHKYSNSNATTSNRPSRDTLGRTSSLALSRPDKHSTCAVHSSSEEAKSSMASISFQNRSCL